MIEINNEVLNKLKNVPNNFHFDEKLHYDYNEFKWYKIYLGSGGTSVHIDIDYEFEPFSYLRITVMVCKQCSPEEFLSKALFTYNIKCESIHGGNTLSDKVNMSVVRQWCEKLNQEFINKAWEKVKDINIFKEDI